MKPQIQKNPKSRLVAIYRPESSAETARSTRRRIRSNAAAVPFSSVAEGSATVAWIRRADRLIRRMPCVNRRQGPQAIACPKIAIRCQTSNRRSCDIARNRRLSSHWSVSTMWRLRRSDLLGGVTTDLYNRSFLAKQSRTDNRAR